MARPERQVSFEVRRGQLVRHVRRSDGRGHRQICTLDVLKAVACVVEQRGRDGVTTNQLWDALPDLPRTQISVALAFLKDRGCVTTEARHSCAASRVVLEDALAEFHALADQETPDR